MWCETTISFSIVFNCKTLRFRPIQTEGLPPNLCRSTAVNSVGKVFLFLDDDDDRLLKMRFSFKSLTAAKICGVSLPSMTLSRLVILRPISLTILLRSTIHLSASNLAEYALDTASLSLDSFSVSLLFLLIISPSPAKDLNLPHRNKDDECDLLCEIKLPERRIVWYDAAFFFPSLATTTTLSNSHFLSSSIKEFRSADL